MVCFYLCKKKRTRFLSRASKTPKNNLCNSFLQYQLLLEISFLKFWGQNPSLNETFCNTDCKLSESADF